MSEEIRDAWIAHRKNYSTFISESEFEHIWRMAKLPVQTSNTSAERVQIPDGFVLVPKEITGVREYLDRED